MFDDDKFSSPVLVNYAEHFLLVLSEPFKPFWLTFLIGMFIFFIQFTMIKFVSYNPSLTLDNADNT
jgi:hypothetical protein